MTDLEQAVAEYSDFYKDTFGYRPRGITFQTLAEVNAAMNSLFTYWEENEPALDGRLEEET
jgi:hypothetical protein